MKARIQVLQLVVCLIAVLTYIHCSVGFFFALKLCPLLLLSRSVGKLEATTLHLPRPNLRFRRCNLWHTKDWIWKQVSIFPFGCSIFGIVLNIWLKMKSCLFNLHIMLPAQLTPSPEYPDLQVHEKERSVLVQYASSWQLCCPVLHSSTNQQVKVIRIPLT